MIPARDSLGWGAEPGSGTAAGQAGFLAANSCVSAGSGAPGSHHHRGRQGGALAGLRHKVERPTRAGSRRPAPWPPLRCPASLSLPSGLSPSPVPPPAVPSSLPLSLPRCPDPSAPALGRRGLHPETCRDRPEDSRPRLHHRPERPGPESSRAITMVTPSHSWTLGAWVLSVQGCQTGGVVGGLGLHCPRQQGQTDSCMTRDPGPALLSSLYPQREGKENWGSWLLGPSALSRAGASPLGPCKKFGVGLEGQLEHSMKQGQGLTSLPVQLGLAGGRRELQEKTWGSFFYFRPKAGSADRNIFWA